MPSKCHMALVAAGKWSVRKPPPLSRSNVPVKPLGQAGQQQVSAQCQCVRRQPRFCVFTGRSELWECWQGHKVMWSVRMVSVVVTPGGTCLTKTPCGAGGHAVCAAAAAQCYSQLQHETRPEHDGHNRE